MAIFEREDTGSNGSRTGPQTNVAAAVAATATAATIAASNTDISGTTPSIQSTSQPGSTNTAGGSSGSKGVSTGVVAGIAVGVAIVVALLTFLATYLFFHYTRRQSQTAATSTGRSRRRRRSSRKDRDPEHKGAYNHDETPLPSGNGNTNDDDAIVLEDHLPQPLSDKTIITEAATLNTLIAQHVGNFYQRTPVNASATAHVSVPPSVEGVISQDKLVSLLTAPGTRQAGLRIYIAASILDCIRVDGEVGRTLLPPEIVAMVGRMPVEGVDAAVRAEALTRWLVLTSFLLAPTSDALPKDGNGAAAAAVQQRETSITNVVSHIAAVLQPFIPRGREDAQIEHLRDIARRAARLGVTLLGQPGGWRFDWTTVYNTREGRVCVFPALFRGAELERGPEVEVVG